MKHIQIWRMVLELVEYPLFPNVSVLISGGQRFFYYRATMMFL